MDGACRTMIGVYSQQEYKLLTGSFCYYYLFHRKGKVLHLDRRRGQALVAEKSDRYPEGAKILPDVDNTKAVDSVCETLEKRECDNWKACCKAALKCCETQISSPKTYANVSHCHRTWDGVSCFHDALPGSRSFVQCPAYYIEAHRSDEDVAFKECDATGHWYIHPDHGRQWTDYTACKDLQFLHDENIISYTCCAVSLCLALAACFIFLWYKPLRRQQRVKVHICFLISFVLKALEGLVWSTVIDRDVLERKAPDRIESLYPLPCRALNMAGKYMELANFLWMFLEGFYLHRLLVLAFKCPKNLIAYNMVGWGLPLVIITVVIILRTIAGHEKCWIEPEYTDWITRVPIFLCVFLNLLFMCNILRILLMKLRNFPQQHSNTRRTIKALFFLMPIFGIFVVTLCYSPHPTDPYAHVYNIISTVVKDLQGAMVSFILCFTNSEVHKYISKSIRQFRYRWYFKRREQRSLSIISFPASLASRRSSRATSYESTQQDKSLRQHNRMIPLASVGSNVGDPFD